MSELGILFVCSGNTCRSPMAEVIFRKMVEDEGLGGRIRVDSAGLHAVLGREAAGAAQDAVGERGLDLSGHRSAALDPDLVGEFDLILTMTNEQRAIVREMVDGSQDVHTLRGYGRGGESGDTADGRCGDETVPDIVDPFGASPEVYRETAREIQEALRGVLSRVKGELEGAS